MMEAGMDKQRRRVPLLQLDPDLGRLVPEERLSSAHRELHVEVHRLASGPWSTGASAEANPRHVGLLLVEGVIAREVVVSDTVARSCSGPATSCGRGRSTMRPCCCS
jgi:hypothetical protein